MNALVTVLFVVAAHLLAPFAVRVFLQPGPVLEQAIAIVRSVAWSVVLLGWSNVLVSAMRASGHSLLGASRNVHAALNRARFELGMGKHADRVLQAAWNRSGLQGLAFEGLELMKGREDAGFDDAGEPKALERIYRELPGQAP
ncbi:GIY-YIG nuclease family protein [Xanthomonas graminis]|uniref:GIY-YIG nuclease family protein n=1 Tax=Xanthomonas graminis TaxID=3390026 RepID=UPI0025401DD1|nr:hypothetical protein [Xanthomonas translucens]